MIVVVAVKPNFELFCKVALRSGNIREEALVVVALVEFVDRIYGSHGGDITEYNLGGSNPHDRSIRLEELLNGLALAEANDVDVEPEVRDGGIPGTWDPAEWRENEVVEGPDENVSECGGGEAKD